MTAGPPAAAGALGLAGTAVRLRLALLRGALRRGPGSTARRVGTALGAVFGLGAAIFALIGLTAARGHGPLPGDLTVLLYNALVLGWVVLPVLTFGSDDLLDPARLALLPLSGRQLMTVMGVGASVGVAPVATAVAALGVLPATGSGPASYLVGLVAVPLEVALCVTTSRAVTSALTRVLRSRRGRDLGVVLAALVAVSFQLVNPLLQIGFRNGGASGAAIGSLAGVLRWTPPGLLAAAAGRSLPAAAGSVLAAGLAVGLMLAAWERGLRRASEQVDLSGPRPRRRTALAPAGLPLPAGRVGAIAAKDLRYLTREPRRLVAAVTGVLVPVLAVVLGPALLTGARPPAGVMFAVCGVGAISALSGGNRFGADGTATWLLISSATDPRDCRRDLLGGDLAAAVVGIPTMVAVAVLLGAVTGGWAYLPSAVGLALALFAVGLGCADLLSVAAPYAVPPTQNVFGGGGGGQGFTAGMLGLVALVAPAVICLPLLGLLLPGLILHAPAWGFALLLAGPGYGAAAGWVMRRAAAGRWSARAPEVLQVLASARS